MSYLDGNDFMGHYRYRDNGEFNGLAAGKPSIYPIYWSGPQMQARQDENMVAVRRFLNGFWKHESEGRTWFDPSHDTAYPDRIRRSAPGTTSKGLSAHTDAGSLERWLLPAYHQVFRHVLDGNPSAYDPWDAAYRTDVDEYQSTVMCSVFRTFQGWTALSSMARAEGVLNVLPIPHAMVYLLLRALQDDVPDDDLCGAANGQSLPVTEARHSVLRSAGLVAPVPPTSAPSGAASSASTPETRPHANERASRRSVDEVAQVAAEFVGGCSADARIVAHLLRCWTDVDRIWGSDRASGRRGPGRSEPL